MTREEAIEYSKNLREYMRITDKKSEYKFLEENYIALEMAIKALEQEPTWIPVSERLPEEEGLYLVYTEEQPFVCSFEDGEFFIDEVLAWMPLPEPYKAESEGEKWKKNFQMR